ncbi:hypothetical protein GE09DRAFT_1159089 [Coniochaeta sp. 2T2.1]|nr:hypothetical protein GE09DRAFT_1159089 [Coniochaeta sp. 2T2.1]
MLLTAKFIAVVAAGSHVVLAQSNGEILADQARGSVTVTVDIADSCEDFNNVNCTYKFLGAGIQTVSYFDSGGDAIVWGDVNIGSVENLLSQQANGLNQTKHKRALTITPPGVWPNAVIRYQYDSQTSANLLRSLIDDAVVNWVRVAPFLSFVEETTGAGPVYGPAPNGVLSILANADVNCQATVGYIAGGGMILTMTPQSSGLAGYCGLHAAVHELGHSLSFFHEQQRSDRGQPAPGGGLTYVCANVEGGCGGALASNFNTRPGNTNGPYDVLSVMHYSRTAFGAPDGAGGQLVTLQGAPTAEEVDARVFPTVLEARRLCELYPTFCAVTGYCGDGIIQGQEECDPPWRRVNNDGCSSTCFLEVCGDGILQIGEDCDDGNSVNGDGCSSTCKVERCGDGIIQGREECDDGNLNDDDGCSAACQIEECGDGIIQGSEQCDDGNLVDGDGCSSKCILETCGDGIVQPLEECDDGNTLSGDGCSANCKVEKCGDGVLQRSLGEECDDGDLINGDGCSSTCKREHAPPEGCCGDGIVQPGFGEECDDGNMNDGDGCSSSCHLEANPCQMCTHRKMCGDGIVQIELGEECDDGNVLGGDGCSANCRKETTCLICEDYKGPYHPDTTTGGQHYPDNYKYPQNYTKGPGQETGKHPGSPPVNPPVYPPGGDSKDSHTGQTPTQSYPAGQKTNPGTPTSTSKLVQVSGSGATTAFSGLLECALLGLVVAVFL